MWYLSVEDSVPKWLKVLDLLNLLNVCARSVRVDNENDETGKEEREKRKRELQKKKNGFAKEKKKLDLCAFYTLQWTE